MAMPVKLRTEYLERPLGVDATHPRLGWVIKAEGRGYQQSAYRVLVATNTASLDRGEGDVWDSGKTVSDQSVFVPYNGAALMSGCDYYWKVMVWDADDQPSDWSEPSMWSTGLLRRSDWQASWIGLPFGPDETNRPATYFRKTLTIDKPVRRAVVYATALGVMSLWVNGERVGSDYLAPEWTDYETRLYYRTYEITGMLREGGNAIGSIVGDGWFCGHVAWFGPKKYGESPRFLMQATLEFEDGTSQTIGTDNSWQAARGAILSSDIMMGERYDARLERAGWSTYTCEDGEWKQPGILGDYKARLRAQPSPPIQSVEQLEPVSVNRSTENVLIADMGQNMVGWARIAVRGPAGSVVQLRYGEMLNADGSLYTENLRKAEQKDCYTLKEAAEQVYEPNFTYHGFRYVELTLDPGVELAGLTGIVVHNAMARTGWIRTSDSRINRLFDNVVWTQRANFVSVPTDCPQRDERMGWTGDAQIFSRTATYNMDVSGFLAKFMIDMSDAQRKTGAFTDVAPFMKNPAEWGMLAGSAGWADAGVIIPWTLYQVYGDRGLLEEHYSAMSAWISFLEELNPGLLRVDRQYYGDWLSLGDKKTPMDVFATAYFAYSAKLMIDIAGWLGKKEDAQRFLELFERIRQAFIAAYVDEQGVVKGDTQTGQAMALYMDLLPEHLRSPAVCHLVHLIEEQGMHMTTGIHGIKYLLPVLSDAGYNEIAYQLLLQDTYPSWLYSVKHGATTIWERWDGWTEDSGFQDPGMNSFNHYALGSVGEWMYRYMGGIDLAPGEPGFKRIRIRPLVDRRLTEVDCRYDSSYGQIGCRWQLAEDLLNLTVVIPANTTAIIHLPCGEDEPISENGTALTAHPHLQDAGYVSGERLVLAGSGEYRFRLQVKQ